MARLAAGWKAQVLVTAAWALGLVLLVLLTFSWNNGRSRSDNALLALFPEDPAVTYDDALDDLRASQGRNLPGILRRVDRAVPLDPLDGRPLFLHALQRVLARSSEPPIGLLETARERSPRFAETRLLLLDLYGRNGRAEDAIREAQSLMNLMPDQQQLIVRLIAGLAGRPGGPEALVHSLPRSGVRGDVMLRLAHTGADSALLERLADPMRGLANDPAQRQWIAQLVSDVAARPDLEGARTLWAIFHDVAEQTVGTAVADGEFDRGGGDPPFGWTFAPGRAGAATVRDNALEVYYYGRTKAIFASQMLLLAPGTYVLKSAATSTDTIMPRGFSWQLACSGGDTLVTTPLARFAAPGGEDGVRFSVPASGCEGQWLRLIGVPADVPRSQSVRIERVAIERTPR